MKEQEIYRSKELLGKANPLDFMYEPPPGFVKDEESRNECEGKLELKFDWQKPGRTAPREEYVHVHIHICMHMYMYMYVYMSMTLYVLAIYSTRQKSCSYCFPFARSIQMEFCQKQNGNGNHCSSTPFVVALLFRRQLAH